MNPSALRRGRLSSSPETLDDRSNLSRAQFLMWLGQELDPEVPLYNMVQTFRIGGRLDPAAFDEAWRALVRRSDALRTTVTAHDGFPRQRVRDDVDASVEIVDVRSEADPQLAAERWVADRKVRPLRLSERLWDSALLLVGADECLWYLCQHHLITDGQAFALVFRGMAELYRLALESRLSDAPAIPAFADYLHYERQSRSSGSTPKALAYWRTKLTRAKPATSFYGRTASGHTARTDRILLELGPDRSARLRAIARTSAFGSLSDELSLHTIWATLLFAALHRITGQTTLRIGTPFLGRPTSAFRSTIGLFIEIGVLDLDVRRDDTFTTLATRVQRELMQGALHARPGVSSAELNRSYDVLLNSVTSRFDRFGGHAVSTDWVHTGFGDRDHALRVQIADFDGTGAFRWHVDVNVDVFGATERRWLLEQIEVVVDRFIEAPDRPLGGFDLLTGAQRSEHLDRFNDTGTAYPRDSSVIDLFERQVRLTPDATALRCGLETRSYAQLDADANRVAHLLRQRGVTSEALVAIALPRSLRAVVAILGVLKSGGAYVPVDPSYPRARRRLIVDSVRPVVVIADADQATDSDDAWPVLTLTDEVTGPLPSVPLDVTRGPDELAYVIFTSGSTGRPKGAMLTHRGLVNYLWWAKGQYLDGAVLDFPLYSSLSFDLTITSLFLPLITGGCLVVYERSRHGDGLEILDVFEDDAVDIVKLTPAHLALARERDKRCQRIGRVILGGENLRTDVARDARQMFPRGVAIFNEYGPTETVVGCMIHRFDAAIDTGPSVPIGRPAANVRIRVVDQYDQPVPPGVAGEMLIGGDGVARGYLGEPELTAQRFLERDGLRFYRTGDLARWGADGRLEFLGRSDEQVKIRGARIELGDIEAALRAHPAIADATVQVVSLGRHARRCVRCGLPSTYPDAGIDDSGTCADCRAFAEHREQVARYFKTPADLAAVLQAVTRRAGDKPYDCLVLVSGGKDSTYMLYQLVREYGLRPLAFTLDNGYISAEALANVRSACADLGVDLHVASTPHMRAIFADSLQRHANVCDGCFKTIYTLSMRLARERGIDTIVTGLSRGQLFETRLADTFAAREFDPDTIDAWVMDARQAYHRIDDAVFQLLDADLFTNEASLNQIRFIDFYRFVDVPLDEVYRYLAADTVWRRPSDTGRSTNCLINDVGIYVHTKTRGFHNYALPYSWDVRLGHKTRAAALLELDDEIDVSRVRRILAEIGFPDPQVDQTTDTRLAAYYVAREPVATSDVQTHLASQLPAFMVPTYLVPLETLPLSVNGKIDRAALPDPRRSRANRTATRVAPRTETERCLADIWSDVLQMPDVGMRDNFFDLGGDSIASIRIVAAARRRGLRLSARDLFTHQTIEGLASQVKVAPSDVVDSAPAPSVTPGADLDPAVRDRVTQLLTADGGWDAVEDIYPLTPTQLGMLYHSLRSESAATYFGQGTCTFDGPVDGARFERAWQAVCQRHPATRVRFLWSGLDTPLQVVQRQVAFPWEHHDWREMSGETTRQRLEDLLRRHREQGFDLRGVALMRFALVQTDTSTLFVWNSHHALLDGWSAHLLFDEVLREYAEASGADQPRPARPFRDHVIWLMRQDPRAAEQWWRGHLSGIDTATPLPLPAPVSPAEPGHDSRTRSVDAAASMRLLAFARERRLTLNTLANGAWGIVLSHYSGSRDVVIGSTVSGREDDLDGIDRIVGMLIATLPVRLTIENDQHVGDWLAGLQRDALESRRYGHVGLTEIQRLTAIPTTQALFDSIVVVENYPTTQTSSSLCPSTLTIGAPSNYPLALLVHPRAAVESDAHLVLEAVYDRARFSPKTIDRLLGHVEHTLSAMVDGADATLGALTVLGPAERSNLWALGTGLSHSTPPGLVHEWIAEHAATRPDSVAVVGPDGELTYAELDALSSQLANRLRRLGVERGQCLGLLTVNSRRSIVGIQAILKVGAAYVPIDPDTPASRLLHVSRESGMRIVLGDGAFDVPPDAALTSVDLSNLGTVLPLAEGERGLRETGPTSDDLAYVIYTSGSTGTPKGVMVSHRNLAHSTAVRFGFYGETVTSFLLLSPMAFDSSLVGLFWTLASGGTLVIPPGDRRHDITFLGRAVERHAVTHLLALPTLYALLLEEAPPTSLDSLRTVMVAGETCPTSLVAQHRTRCPQAKLVNEYGPTEGTVWSHAFRVTDTFSGGAVPIGAPIPNSWCRVLDHFGHPTPMGVPGELVIGGPGIAAGYLNRPDLTAQAFRTLPEWLGAPPGAIHYFTGDLVRWLDDGQLDFLGRIDRQIKLRGYRIELEEVERALLDAPGVRAAAALITRDASDAARERLVACYCAEEDFDEATCRTALTARLPHYMVPALVRVDAMPTTATGKIDRAALASHISARGEQRLEARAPIDEVERMLVAVVGAVLKRPSIGVEENFFELGGNSLDAMRLFAQIERRTGRSLRLSTLFDAPTVAGLAAVLRARAETTVAGDPSGAPSGQLAEAGTPDPPRRASLVLIHKGVGRAPLFCVHGAGGNLLIFRSLAERLGADQPVYGFEAEGVDGVAQPAASIEEMARQYVEELRGVQPHGPYVLGGYSGGGVTALEMAHQLVAAGERVDRVVLLDTFHPSTQARTLGFADHLAGITEQGLGYVPRRLMARVERQWQALRRRVRLRHHANRHQRIPPDLREDRLISHFARLAQQYGPRPYHGRVTLFRAKDIHRIFTHVGPRLGWDAAVLPYLTVVEIPGDHNSVFREPHIDALAKQVSALLRSADDHHNDSR